MTLSLEPVKVSQHPAKFGDHRHSGSGDIMVLICHVISQGHVMNWSYELKGRNPSRKATLLQSSVAIATLVVVL